MATTTRVDNHGEVFTRGWVVETILDLVGYSRSTDLTSTCIVEPSCGSGPFLGSIIERLLASAADLGVAHAALGDCIQAFDLQRHHAETCREMAANLLQVDGCDADLAAKLAKAWVRSVDYLLDSAELSADYVVGNPPYIRIEDLDPAVAATYRERWSTMNGRADIYVPFFERSLLSLRPQGRLGFICADRWFRNSYGSALRSLVAERFSVEHVWSMHDVDAFASDVSAYPAITVISNGVQGAATVLDTDRAFGAESAIAATDWAMSSRKSASGSGFEGHRLPHWFGGAGFWPTGSPARLALIEFITDRFSTLEDDSTGTKVGIGVATGADKVYCIQDPDLVEAERALPLVTGKDLNSGTFDWSGEYLANVWLPDGSLVDLAEYPRLAGHLERWGDQLRHRHTAKKNPANWHRTIDKVNHSLLEIQGLSAGPLAVVM
jgi:hypothetical protein